MKTETDVQDDASLTEDQRAYLEKINAMKTILSFILILLGFDLPVQMHNLKNVL